MRGELFGSALEQTIGAGCFEAANEAKERSLELHGEAMKPVNLSQCRGQKLIVLVSPFKRSILGTNQKAILSKQEHCIFGVEGHES